MIFSSLNKIVVQSIFLVFGSALLGFAAQQNYTLEARSLFHINAFNEFSHPYGTSTQLSELPETMRWNPDEGLLTWLPDYDDAGIHNVELTFNPGTPQAESHQLNFNVQAAEKSYITQTDPVAFILQQNTPTNDSTLNDHHSLEELLKRSGLTYQKISSLNLENISLKSILVVPHDQSLLLNSEQIQEIETFVRRGGKLLMFGRTPLSERLGVSFTNKTLHILEYQDFLNPMEPANHFFWEESVVMESFDSNDNDIVFTIDKKTQIPITIGRRMEKGRFIYVGTDFYDDVSSLGHKRHPYLTYHFKDYFHLQSYVKAGSIDIYFDQGNYDLSKVYIEDIVRRWSLSGVKNVYCAAWHTWINEQTGDVWTFNYENFINVCHLYGLKVYAWFAIPHISQEFWVTNPECREKSGAGTDDYLGWRLMINLQNSECFAKALDYYKNTINNYNWDGINLVEIYYEFEDDTFACTDNPECFTPMNDDIRNEFESMTGIDPISFFDKTSPHYYKIDKENWSYFLEYRSSLVTQLHEIFLKQSLEIAENNKGIGEVILTLVDDLHSGYEGIHYNFLNTGVNVPEIMALLDDYDFTLQVEDPWPLWMASPDRYKDFRETYLNAYEELNDEPERLYFDVNIVELIRPTFPTYKQTGIETQILLDSIYNHSGRIALFSEHSIYPLDLGRYQTYLAADTKIKNVSDRVFEIKSNKNVYFSTDELYFADVALNGEPWPCWSSISKEVIIPPGTHQLEFLTTSNNPDMKIYRITTPILSARQLEQGVEVTYDSPRERVVISVESFSIESIDEFVIRVNNELYDADIYPFYGHFHLYLPKGKNTVQILKRSM